jgi:putative spermidine/putrescine transport system substrate-binding protein
MSKYALVTVGAALLVASALAIDPVGNAQFNVTPGDLDLKALSAQNFMDRVVTAAKKQGSLTFYDFTESFAPLFKDNVLPRFEKKYGITVKYLPVDGANAVQQLIAAKKANQPSPVDVFFMPNGLVETAVEAGIVANLPLNKVLPSAPDLTTSAATVSRGFAHNGVVVPFHRNQTAIGYNTRFVAAGTEPTTFEELLAYAKRNPKRFAMTSPSKGGSGSGFLESAILNFVKSEACRAPLYDKRVEPPQAAKWATDCLGPVMDYFKELAPSVEITNGNTDTLNLIANGAAYVGTIWEDQSYDFIGRGLLPATVKFRLLKSGQVGDGDGVMIPAGTQKLAAALLFTDFLLSDEIQGLKLELNGSRSARTRLDLSKVLKPENAARLLPADQYSTLSRARINGDLSTAAVTRFTTDILQGK